MSENKIFSVQFPVSRQRISIILLPSLQKIS